MLLNKFIAELASKYRVDVNLELLRKVPVTFINMIAVRFLGFNNRMLAVPLLERMTDWVEFTKGGKLLP
jgi:hypothetical protein